MACSEARNAYEELRRRNVERNEEMLRELGLCPPREKEIPLRKPGRAITADNNSKEERQPRRSRRIANMVESSLPSEKIQMKEPLLKDKGASSAVSEGAEDRPDLGITQGRRQGFKEGQSYTKSMEETNTVEECFADCSSGSSYGERPVSYSNKREDVEISVERNHTSAVKQPGPSTSSFADVKGMPSTAAFGTQLQELILRAFSQATAAIIAPASLEARGAQDEGIGKANSSGAGLSPESTWKQTTFNKVEASRRRKPIMNRTSAGESSDSQQEFPIPENETPQQKSVRARKLNRCRERRAKDLTSNRRAVNKRPYVLHVDGMGKGKGIHKHRWHAAVRGQCGRLDPSMDNINHHPKLVVDSIWHALEKEWEFEGFSHRAREMFEKSATKFMRNRKMQLKYRCQKEEKPKKPVDVNPTHWGKIVQSTKKSLKQRAGSGAPDRESEGKEQILEKQEGESNVPTALQETEAKKRKWIARDGCLEVGLKADAEDVNARIRSLEIELLRLQKSRKVGVCVDDGEGGQDLTSDFEVPVEDAFEDGMKENTRSSTVLRAVTGKKVVKKKSEEGEATWEAEGKMYGTAVNASEPVPGSELEEVVKQSEMNCGDVVRLLAVKGGIKKEVGKGIVMGLAGTKYGRKVIPKGWRIVKVTAHTSIGYSEICPIPAGWTEQVKNHTLKEASGRTIIWPDALLRSLLEV